MNVIINPNLQKIEIFFKSIKEDLESSFKELDAKKTATVLVYSQERASQLTHFKKDLIREFELEFIELINSNSSKLSEELLNWSRSLVDEVTLLMDRIMEEDDTNEINEELFSCLSASKANFYSIISNPVKIEFD